MIHIRSCGYKLKIEFPNHASGNAQYLDQLKHFSDGRGSIIPTIGMLGLSNAATTILASPSGLEEHQAPIYIRLITIGSGGFANVWKVLDSRDGGVFAAKVFNPVKAFDSAKRTQDAHRLWEMTILNEVRIMKENVHVGYIYCRKGR